MFYLTADIHGDFDNFVRMLKKIQFNTDRQNGYHWGCFGQK